MGKCEAASKGELLARPSRCTKPVLLKTIRVTKLTFDEVAVTGRDPIFQQELQAALRGEPGSSAGLPAVTPGGIVNAGPGGEFNDGTFDDLGRTR